MVTLLGLLWEKKSGLRLVGSQVGVIEGVAVGLVDGMPLVCALVHMLELTLDTLLMRLMGVKLD
jgi:hypothetical protein